MEKQIKSGEYEGVVLIPSSKSDGQRAILAAALNVGSMDLYGIGDSLDEQSMLNNIQKLGAVVESGDGNSTIIHGIKEFPPSISLNVGESGLGLRLLTSICAAQSGNYTITGEGSLKARSQHFFEEYFAKIGVKVRSKDGCIPLEIEGPMNGGELEIDGSLSSQFLSGLLMALPMIENDTLLHVKDLKSSPYVQMTLNTLQQFGIQIEHSDLTRFEIKGGQNYKCKTYTIERDWSSASYWLVAAALDHSIVVKGLDLRSFQADTSLLDALVKANCMISFEDELLLIDGENRRAFEFDATDCPDLFPALVVFAAFCDGVSKISGVHRLKNKESDRAVALQQEFEKLGLRIDLKEDDMIVHGGGELKSSTVDAHNDHRIAMCLAIAGTLIDGGLTVTGAESVAKSYPGFWNDMDRLHLET